MRPHPAKFVLHAGFAFGTFHRYVYKPFAAGALKSPAHANLKLAKVAAVTIAVLREVGVAKQDAQGSTALRKFFVPMGGLQAILIGLSSRLKQAHLDRLDIESANGAIVNIERSADASGLRITESGPATAP